MMRVVRRSNVTRSALPGMYLAGDHLPPIAGDLFALATDCSTIDLVEACLPQTGAAHVTIATWTSSTSSTEHAQRLLLDARLLSLTFVVDVSFATRQPHFCQALMERFGRSALRETKTHAKFALVRGEQRALAIIPSMNLNRHTQLETFDILTDPAVVALLEQLSADARPTGVARQTDLFGDGPNDRDLRRVGLSTRAGGMR